MPHMEITRGAVEPCALLNMDICTSFLPVKLWKIAPLVRTREGKGGVLNRISLEKLTHNAYPLCLNKYCMY